MTHPSKVVNMTQLVTVLVGPPCCGKSTYLKQLDYDFAISSDSIVEILCAREGIAYHEFFNFPADSDIKREQQRIFKRLVSESHRFQHVVWDLTNLTKDARKRIFKAYANAKIHAVDFQFKDNQALLFERNKARMQAQGKFIDEAVIHRMIKSYQPVSKGEGFQLVTLQNIK